MNRGQVSKKAREIEGLGLPLFSSSLSPADPCARLSQPKPVHPVQAAHKLSQIHPTQHNSSAHHPQSSPRPSRTHLPQKPHPCILQPVPLIPNLHRRRRRRLLILLVVRHRLDLFLLRWLMSGLCSGVGRHRLQMGMRGSGGQWRHEDG